MNSHIKGDTVFLQMEDEDAKEVVIPDDLFDSLVDQGAEQIVVISRYGRWVSTVEDWLDMSESDELGRRMGLWRMEKC